MSDAQVRRRRPENKYDGSPSTKSESGPPSSSITIVKSPVTKGSEKGAMEWYRQQPAWIILALASGTCAAINGVFAKLTTTASTTNLASKLATLLGYAGDNSYVNLVLRGSFFGLNILFNILMWALFTAALTRASSTTRVSIVNVSANFFITAILGAIVFGEELPLLWWVGASFLAVGNVVIGKREEEQKIDEAISSEESETLLMASQPQVGGMSYVQPVHGIRRSESGDSV